MAWKVGLERELGKMVLNVIFGKKRLWFHTPASHFVHFSHRFLLVSDIAITFTDVNGKRLQYQCGGSRKALESFFRKTYGCCSTFSASRETEPCKISEVQPGDVQVYPVRSNKRPTAIRQQGRRISFAIWSLWRIRGSSSMVTRVPFGCRSSISERMSWDFIKVGWSLHSL